MLTASTRTPNQIDHNLLYIIGVSSRQKVVRVTLPLNPPSQNIKGIINISKLKQKPKIQWPIQQLQINNRVLSQRKPYNNNHINLSNAYTFENTLKFSNIFNSFKYIQFPYLKNLNLSNNNISSIEYFTQFSAPFLTEIILDHNNINNICSLKKNSLFCLKNLTICQNPLNTLESFHQFSFQNLKNLVIQRKNINRQINSNINQFAKFISIIRNPLKQPSRRKCKITLRSQSRIKLRTIHKFMGHMNQQQHHNQAKVFRILKQIIEEIEILRENNRRQIFPGIMFQEQSSDESDGENYWVPKY